MTGTLLLSPELADLIARLGSGLSQHARLITLTQDTETRPDNFAVERITGFEAVNALFRFDVDVLSVNAFLDLPPLLGEPYTLRILQVDGQYRAWHGYCTEARWLGTDGGVARYQLRLEPFLAFPRMRFDSHIFQGKHVLDIVTELFADYPQARFRFDVTRDLPVRDITTQYRESDLDFLTRILARDGLSYRFEHDQTPTDIDTAPTLQAAHMLVIFDHLAAVPDLPGGRTLRFSGVHATESEDTIDGFTSSSQIVTHHVAASSWLSREVIAPSAGAGSPGPQSLPYLEQYVHGGTGRFANTDHGDDWASLQALSLAMDEHILQGQGAVRQLAPGMGFDLADHDAFDSRNQAFTVLSVRHEAVNNLGAGLNHVVPLQDAQDGTYRNWFTAVPASVAILPAAALRLPRPVVPGPQTALVVGLNDAVTTSTRDHQVRIQFHWQRGVSPNPGGLMETGNATDTTGHAPGNEQSGTWVRVAESLSGTNYGSSFTPRIGSEVLVDFMGGDMDQPVIVASLYNGVDTPPFAAGVDGGLDHAGVISGWHSRNFSDDGYNQWLMDDGPEQLQTQLLSSSANSALNLGWLRGRQPASARRGTPRGLGLEARTDAWGQLRGAEGVWISTTQKSKYGTSVTSTQLDVTEAADQLRNADSLNKTLRDAALAQSAQISDAALKAFASLAAKLQPEPSSTAGKELRFDQPVVALDSAASLNTAISGSLVCFAQNDMAWTSQGDNHWCAQHTVSMNSGEATTLFTHDGGLTAIATHAPISLAAHTDALEVLADQAITVTSTDESIIVEAQSRITLQAGQSSITLEGGNITFACPGNFSVKGASHPFGGGGRDSAMLEVLPPQLISQVPFIFVTDEVIEEHYLYTAEDGTPISGINYNLSSSSGSATGKTSTTGETEKVRIKQGEETTQVAWRDKLSPWRNDGGN